MRTYITQYYVSTIVTNQQPCLIYRQFVYDRISHYKSVNISQKLRCTVIFEIRHVGNLRRNWCTQTRVSRKIRNVGRMRDLSTESTGHREATGEAIKTNEQQKARMEDTRTHIRQRREDWRRRSVNARKPSRN